MKTVVVLCLCCYIYLLTSNIIHLMQAIWRNLSSKRNVELNKILDQTIWNIYGIVFKRLKSHASFIRCRIKRLLDVLLYNTGYIWTRTQLEKSYWTRLTARPIWLFKLCTRPNIFPYCTVKRLITYKYSIRSLPICYVFNTIHMYTT